MHNTFKDTECQKALERCLDFLETQQYLKISKEDAMMKINIKIRKVVEKGEKRYRLVIPYILSQEIIHVGNQQTYLPTEYIKSRKEKYFFFSYDKLDETIRLNTSDSEYYMPFTKEEGTESWVSMGSYTPERLDNTLCFMQDCAVRLKYIKKKIREEEIVWSGEKDVAI